MAWTSSPALTAARTSAMLILILFAWDVPWVAWPFIGPCCIAVMPVASGVSSAVGARHRTSGLLEGAAAARRRPHGDPRRPLPHRTATATRLLRALACLGASLPLYVIISPYEQPIGGYSFRINATTTTTTTDGTTDTGRRRQSMPVFFRSTDVSQTHSNLAPSVASFTRDILFLLDAMNQPMNASIESSKLQQAGGSTAGSTSFSLRQSLMAPLLVSGGVDIWSSEALRWDFLLSYWQQGQSKQPPSSSGATTRGARIVVPPRPSTTTTTITTTTSSSFACFVESDVVLNMTFFYERMTTGLAPAEDLLWIQHWWAHKSFERDNFAVLCGRRRPSQFTVLVARLERWLLSKRTRRLFGDLGLFRLLLWAGRAARLDFVRDKGCTRWRPWCNWVHFTRPRKEAAARGAAVLVRARRRQRRMYQQAQHNETHYDPT